MGEAELFLRVLPDPDGDQTGLVELTARLRAELLDLEVDTIEPAAEELVPDRAKGLGAAVGWLVVRFGGAGVRRVIDAARDWLLQNRGCGVEVAVDGQVLKLTHATSDQQDRIVEAFLVRISE